MNRDVYYQIQTRGDHQSFYMLLQMGVKSYTYDIMLTVGLYFELPVCLFLTIADMNSFVLSILSMLTVKLYFQLPVHLFLTLSDVNSCVLFFF